MPKTERSGLPEPIMNTNSTIEQEIPRDKFGELFEITLPRVIKLYENILCGDGGSPIQRVELSRLSSDELQKQLDELALLERTLKEFAQNPTGFEIRTSGISQDENSYRVRLKPPSAGPIGETPDTAQPQLSLYARIMDTGETRSEIMSAHSIRGISPDKALRETERQFFGGQIMITTLGVLRGRSGAFLVIPRAGIELVKEGEFIDLNGLKPVGQHFHRLSVDNVDEHSDSDAASIKDYLLLHDTTLQMSGTK